MAKIALDCDGVLANFSKAYESAAERVFPGLIEKRLPTHWDDFRGLTKAQDKQVWQEIINTPLFWVYLEPLHENVNALGDFLVRNIDHDIYIVTSRTPTKGASIAKQTQMWLHGLGVEQRGNYIGIVPVSRWQDKRKFYEAAGIEYSVDDKMETAEDCDQIGAHEAFLLDQPWNQDAKVKRRIKSLAEFFDSIR